MATEFSREFFADNRIVKASLRCAHKLREKDLDRIKSEIKKLYDATEVIHAPERTHLADDALRRT